MSEDFNGSEYERALNDLHKKVDASIHSLIEKKDIHSIIATLKGDERTRKAQ